MSAERGLGSTERSEKIMKDLPIDSEAMVCCLDRDGSTNTKQAANLMLKHIFS